MLRGTVPQQTEGRAITSHAELTQLLTHPRNPQRLANIRTAMHAEAPRRSAIQDNLSCAHGVISAFK
jgi:hypothetical protein